MTESQDNSIPSPSGDDGADSYIGKYVLVGLAYQDRDGNPLGKEQFHGVITAVGDTAIELSLRGAHDGRIWTMPPDPNALVPADPGNYRLPATGETIHNPDFVCTWTITKARPDEPR